MPRLLMVTVLAVLLAACGSGSGDGGNGGGSGQASASLEAPSVIGELPGPGNVLFGTSWDQATLGITGKTTSVKQGTAPLVVVGRTFTAITAPGVKVQVGQGGSAKPARAVDASDSADTAQLFASDLSKDNLAPGTWIVQFLGSSGRVVASGYLVVTP
ncbi:MAG: hypothetical protein WCK58_14125 [Chloroflexota bacterium]